MKWRHRKGLIKQNKSRILLSNLDYGIKAYVSELCKDRYYRNRIISLGIRVGAPVELIKKAYSENGCMIIRVSGSRLIINHNFASKVKVTYTEQNQE
ncbi:MAG: ferrous iron transport protein A [Victivallales bacterium]|nr:ferrous iron transport protein A [Victivallales bacterium]